MSYDISFGWTNALIRPCQFPFTFKNKTYNNCVTSNDEYYKPWCSTKVNFLTNEHVERQGYWGYCPMNNENCMNEPMGTIVKQFDYCLERDMLPFSKSSQKFECFTLLSQGKLMSNGLFNGFFPFKTRKLKTDY